MRRLLAIAAVAAMGLMAITPAVADHPEAQRPFDPDTIRLELFEYGKRHTTLLTACDGSEVFAFDKPMRIHLLGKLVKWPADNGAPSEHYNVDMILDGPTTHRVTGATVTRNVTWTDWDHQNRVAHSPSQLIARTSFAHFDEYPNGEWTFRAVMDTLESGERFIEECSFRVESPNG